MKVILDAKTRYASRVIENNGNTYRYIKIVEGGYLGNFLILIESIVNGQRFMVNLEKDSDFKVKVK